MDCALPHTTCRNFYLAATWSAEVVLIQSSQVDSPYCGMSQNQLISKHSVLWHDPKSALVLALLQQRERCAGVPEERLCLTAGTVL